MRRNLAETTPRSASSVPSIVDRLVELFPGAVLMRLPVEVISVRAGSAGLKERTVIEFGTAREALFASSLPLEFADRVRLVNADGSLDAEASVIAVHFEQGRRAVAVRFSQKVPNWIIQ